MWRPGGGGSAELANLEGVDVLLEGNRFAVVEGPHVDHLHSGRLTSLAFDRQTAGQPRRPSRSLVRTMKVCRSRVASPTSAAARRYHQRLEQPTVASRHERIGDAWR